MKESRSDSLVCDVVIVTTGRRRCRRFVVMLMLCLNVSLNCNSVRKVGFALTPFVNESFSPYHRIAAVGNNPVNCGRRVLL